MKIAIIGYGRMGKEIETLALSKGHQIVAIIDNEDDWKTRFNDIKKADVAIEFSMPETAVENILKCFGIGLPVVSGTTGWDKSFEEIKKNCISGGHALFYASNFSPGMNIMFELNKKLAALMSRQEGYEILVEETHHKGKKDAPSGTAITLANEIIRVQPDKIKWVNRTTSDNQELEIISVRRDQVPGTHFVKYTSDIDNLEIKHTAHSRKGFAFGAILAAGWLTGKTGCYGMHDLLYENE